MTVSSSYAFNPSADDIVRQAFQYAGVLALGRRPRPDQLSDARDLLSTLLKEMQAGGTMLTTAERTTLALTNGTATYALAPDTIEVQFPTTLLAAGSTAETIVERLSYSGYAELSDKTALGTPVQAYPETQPDGTQTVTFWNVPNGSFTWKYRRVRLIRDTDTGAATLDTTRKYIQAVIWKLAHRVALASTVPLARVQYLEVQAAAAEAKVTGDDNERGDMQILLMDAHGRY